MDERAGVDRSRDAEGRLALIAAGVIWILNIIGILSFGKQEVSFAGEKFEGAEVHTSFGGVEIRN